MSVGGMGEGGCWLGQGVVQGVFLAVCEEAAGVSGLGVRAPGGTSRGFTGLTTVFPGTMARAVSRGNRIIHTVSGSILVRRVGIAIISNGSRHCRFA